MKIPHEIERQIKSVVKKHMPNQNKKWVKHEDWVHYAGPWFTDQEYVAAITSILNGWLVLGESANLFENSFPKILGKSKGILTNSGSSANLLMLASLTSKRGFNFPKRTKVITPVSGFPTTINPILQVGFNPLFVDIEDKTLNLDLDQVETLCSADPTIRILMFAHTLGNPPDMSRVMYLKEKYNLILLEDCCDALGSLYKGQPLGSFGDMASCSFYPAHHITMGEGGFVATDRTQMHIILKSFRDWGRGCYCSNDIAITKDGECGRRFSNWISAFPQEIFDHKYVFEEVGYNLKPTEIQAAIGLVQMEKIHDITCIRQDNYNRLHDIFAKYPEHFYVHESQENAVPSWFAFPVTMMKGTHIKRSDVCQYFEENLIQTRPFFAGNILLQPAYECLRKGKDVRSIMDQFPVASRVMTDTFFIGTSPIITNEQIDYVEEILDNFMKNRK